MGVTIVGSGQGVAGVKAIFKHNNAKCNNIRQEERSCDSLPQLLQAIDERVGGINAALFPSVVALRWHSWWDKGNCPIDTGLATSKGPSGYPAIHMLHYFNPYSSSPLEFFVDCERYQLYFSL